MINQSFFEVNSPILEIFLIEKDGKDMYLAISEERRRYIPPGVMADWEYQGQRSVDDEMFYAVDVETSLVEYGYVLVPKPARKANSLRDIVRSIFHRT